MGSSVVNALSSKLVATIIRGGKKHQQEYRRGKPRGPVEVVGEGRGSGTTIVFTPDEEIFGDLTMDPNLIREHLEVSAEACAANAERDARLRVCAGRQTGR